AHRRLSAPHCRPGCAHRPGRALTRTARGGASPPRRAGAQLAAHRRRLQRPRRARRARWFHDGDRDHGRPLRQVRQGPRCRLRRGGHALRRPHRRDAVHARHDRRVRRTRTPQRDKEPDKVSPGWPRESDLRTPVQEPEFGWLAPFMMADVNTRVVRRSNALQDWAYGSTFRYREVMGVGYGPAGFARAAGITGGLGTLMAGMSFGPTRSLLDRVLPKPGQGPSE